MQVMLHHLSVESVLLVNPIAQFCQFLRFYLHSIRLPCPVPKVFILAFRLSTSTSDLYRFSSVINLSPLLLRFRLLLLSLFCWLLISAVHLLPPFPLCPVLTFPGSFSFFKCFVIFLFCFIFIASRPASVSISFISQSQFHFTLVYQILAWFENSAINYLGLFCTVIHHCVVIELDASASPKDGMLDFTPSTVTYPCACASICPSAL